MTNSKGEIIRKRKKQINKVAKNLGHFSSTNDETLIIRGFKKHKEIKKLDRMESIKYIWNRSASYKAKNAVDCAFRLQRIGRTTPLLN